MTKSFVAGAAVSFHKTDSRITLQTEVFSQKKIALLVQYDKVFPRGLVVNPGSFLTG